MSASNDLAVLIERWFTDRLMRHRGVSSNTIACYRDTFRLLFAFAQTRLGRSPSQLTLRDLDAPFIGAFLEDIETLRSASVRTRNLRLTAIWSFFRYASFEEPAHSAQIQRVLAIPCKRCDKRQLQFLTRPEIEAILACPDRSTWLGRRDHTLLLLAAQTGLRVGDHRSRPGLGDAGARCPRAMRWQGPQGAKYAAPQGCTASPSGLAQRAQETGCNGSLSEHARRQAERRRRAGAAEQICRQGSRTLRHPPLEAGVATCFEAQRCNGAAAGGRRLFGHRPMAGP